MCEAETDSFKPRSPFRRACAIGGALVISILIPVLGCGSADDGSEGVVSKSPLSQSPTTEPVESDPALVACFADRDCKAVAVYCGQCTCEAFSKDVAAPKCSGNVVACFKNPCLGKTAVCVTGTCVVSDEASM